MKISFPLHRYFQSKMFRQCSKESTIPFTSDYILVMWRLSRSKSRFFRKIEWNQYRNFLEQLWLDSDIIPPQRDRRLAQYVTEWALHPREYDHVVCGGVYTFNSEYWGENRNQTEFFIKKSNRITRKQPQSSHHYYILNHLQYWM